LPGEGRTSATCPRSEACLLPVKTAGGNPARLESFPHDEEVYVRALAWMPGQDSAVPISAEEMATLRRKKKGVLWADYPAPTDQDFDYLRATFGFDAVTIDECHHDGQHRAKVSDHGDYLFVIWPVLVERAETEEISASGLFIFIGADYLITVHDDPLPVLEDVSRSTVDDSDIAIQGSDWLLLRILDNAVDAYFPAIDRLTEKLDEIEDVMFENPSKAHMASLFAIKRAMLTLRRMAGPERDVVNLLARHESRLIDSQTFVYFQDVYDHLARITDSIDMSRDVIGGAMDIYLSSISNRMNEIMKRLTVVATVFMPLTFVTSLYGMNVRLPLDRHGSAFYVIVGVMVGIAIAMLIDFRRRGWW